MLGARENAGETCLPIDILSVDAPGLLGWQAAREPGRESWVRVVLLAFVLARS